MAKKKDDIFDRFLDKSFGDSTLHIEKPLGGDRSTTEEERRVIARRPASEDKPVETVSVAVNEKTPKTIGRPKTVNGPVRLVNFYLEEDMRHDLELLKVRQYRSSLTELLKEAIVDLLKKYGVEGY